MEQLFGSRGINRFIVTGWRAHEENGLGRPISYLRVSYGFTYIAGNCRPYFSLTAEEVQQAYGRAAEGEPVYDVPAMGRWEIMTAGTLDSSVRQTFPELAGLIKWHLVDDEGLPMHYLANSDYWMTKHLGVFRLSNNSEHEGRLRGEPDPLEAFKSTIVFGALESDELELTTIITNERRRPTVALEDLRPWLISRLPALQVTMQADMAAHGVQYIRPEETR